MCVATQKAKWNQDELQKAIREQENKKESKKREVKGDWVERKNDENKENKTKN